MTNDPSGEGMTGGVGALAEQEGRLYSAGPFRIPPRPSNL